MEARTVIHRVMYPVLGLIILGQTYLLVGSLEQAIRLDHTTQSLIEDKASINALLRFIGANTRCDTTPKQLASKMGPTFLLGEWDGVPQVANGDFGEV
jgi:hypothetical protein